MSRTQPERSAATKAALVSAARRLWGERGYAAASPPEIAEAAGVTRGAMYHQYANKTELFVAVIEAIETVDPSWFCIGVQWHPESETASALDMQLFEGFVQACIRAERSFISVAA